MRKYKILAVIVAVLLLFLPALSVRGRTVYVNIGTGTQFTQERFLFVFVKNEEEREYFPLRSIMEENGACDDQHLYYALNRSTFNVFSRPLLQELCHGSVPIALMIDEAVEITGKTQNKEEIKEELVRARRAIHEEYEAVKIVK